MMRVATAVAGVGLVLVPVAAEPAWAYPLTLAGLICALVTLWPQLSARIAHRAGTAGRDRAAIGAGPAGHTRPANHTGPASHARPANHTGPAGQAGPAGSTGAVDRADAPTGGSAADGVAVAAGTLAAVLAIAECAVSRLDTAAMAGEGLLLLGFLLLLGRPAGLAGGAARTWLRLRVPAVLAAAAVTGIVLAALAAGPGSSPWLALGGLAAAVAAYVVAAPRGRSRGSRPG